MTRAVADADLPKCASRWRVRTKLGELGTAIFDTVVLNSVVQYFPNVEYLVSVLEAAVAATATGGSVFVGDVRNLGLLDAFHADVLAAREMDLPEDQLRGSSSGGRRGGGAGSSILPSSTPLPRTCHA